MADLITRDTLDLAALQKRQGHKYDHGHALVVSGWGPQTGAARLAARAALRIGAGAVTLAVPPGAVPIVAAHETSVMIKSVDDDATLNTVLQDTRMNALCLGPAMGISPKRRDLLEAALRSGRASTLDADALTMMADNPDVFDLTHDRCVLTPHEGEFARLFPDIAARLKAAPQLFRAEAVGAAARRAGCVVLLKGPQTLIAAPDGTCWMHAANGPRATPWLATAGAGDVLAGLITGLMARGFDPVQAAIHASWLHVSCALALGPGLIAEDLPGALPAVLNELLG